jgi:lysozyme
MSNEGIAMLIAFEGERLVVYKDPVGLPTFGVGHLVTPAEKAEFPVGKKITRKVSREYLRNDLAKFENCVNSLVDVPITQNQFDAMVSLAFNIGQAGFKRSSVLRHLNNRKYSKAADAFLAWNKAGGRVLQGLTRRRETERSVFLSPDSTATQEQSTGANDPGTSASQPLDKPQQNPPDGSPSIFTKIFDWIPTIRSKADEVMGLNKSLSPISSSSKFRVIVKEVVGVLLLIYGFLWDNPVYLVLGLALIGIAAWFLSKSKDRGVLRVTPEQTQTQTVEIKT